MAILLCGNSSFSCRSTFLHLPTPTPFHPLLSGSQLCQSKALKYARKVVIINRWEPTSQVCSSCGYRWGKLNLKIRTVVCLGCGETHCRDWNASKNIEQVGVGHTHDSKQTGLRCTRK